MCSNSTLDLTFAERNVLFVGTVSRIWPWPVLTYTNPPQRCSLTPPPNISIVVVEGPSWLVLSK